MNFFAHQAKARSNTTRLVLLFALAIASLIFITEVFLLWLSPLFLEKADRDLLGGTSLLIISTFVIGVVIIAWMYKSIQLAQGGKVIAEAMDGKLITLDTRDPDEKKILNVVEEMAIASGIPIPPVYVMEEHGINAFAAGYSQRDAVIGITRGAIRALNRDELQGVVAHEFSHIFNGDMRLNIRLISVLHGILVIGMIGESLLDMSDRRRHRHTGWFAEDKKGGPHGNLGLYAMGLGLYIIGYLGHFFGSLIKAAVSREREFLADATAVQYTRNPQGIGNALRKIGGFPLGAYVIHPEGSEISHLFFADGIKKRFFDGLATHPPLKERIRRVDPAGGSRFLKVTLPEEAKINPYLLKASREGIDIDPEAYKKPEAPRQLEPIEFLGALAAGSVTTTTAVECIGTPSQQHIKAAQEILHTLPEQLKKIARDSYDVQALIYCFLLDRHRGDVLEQQLAHLEKQVSADIYREVLRIKEKVNTLPPRHRLPLMDIAITTLKQLSSAQYQAFKSNMLVLIKTDKVVDLVEWAIFRMVIHHLESKASTGIGYKSLPTLHREIQSLLSAIALASSENGEQATQAFQRGWQMLKLAPAELLQDSLQQITRLDQALKKSNRLHPLKKPLLIKACCAALHQEEDPEGIELIRTIVDGLDVPMPPLLEKQKLC